MSTKAVYAGTFDPVTNGHLDVIKRASRLFDSLIVAVGNNPRKKPCFSIKERILFLKESTKSTTNVQIEEFSGLLVDFAKKKKARILIRGLRELSDFELEFQQAIINRKLDPEIETVIIVTDEKYFYINSTIAKELAALKANISCFVPPAVEKALKQKLGKKN